MAQLLDLAPIGGQPGAPRAVSATGAGSFACRSRRARSVADRTCSLLVLSDLPFGGLAQAPGSRQRSNRQRRAGASRNEPKNNCKLSAPLSRIREDLIAAEPLASRPARACTKTARYAIGIFRDTAAAAKGGARPGRRRYSAPVAYIGLLFRTLPDHPGRHDHGHPAGDAVRALSTCSGMQRAVERGFFGGMAAGLGIMLGDGLIALGASLGVNAISGAMRRLSHRHPDPGRAQALLGAGVKLYLTPAEHQCRSAGREGDAAGLRVGHPADVLPHHHQSRRGARADGDLRRRQLVSWR